MNPRYILIVVAVLATALALRFHPAVSESFQYDAVTSQLAAQKGVWANAWDDQGSYELRRMHPPLLSYVIVANNAVFGDDPYRARWFSILAGGITAALVAAAVITHGRGLPGGAVGMGALVAGLHVAFLPVHLYVSRTANWDALYGLLATVCLFALVRNHLAPHRGWRLLAGAGGALAFLTSEAAVALGPAVMVAVVQDLRGRPGARLREWFPSLGLAAALVLLLWPAGVIELDVGRTLLFRYRDSALAARNAPWTDFYRDLATDAPAFVATIVLGGLGYLLTRGGPSTRSHATTGAALLPWVVYVLTVVVLSTRQRLVYLHHISDLLPALTVLMGVGIMRLTAVSRSWLRRGAVAVAAGGFLVGAAIDASDPDPDRTGPQEHPGFLGVAAYFAEHRGGSVYYYYEPTMALYDPEGEYEGRRPRDWSLPRIAEIRADGFDYVVSDWSMFSSEVPDVAALGQALGSAYVLDHTVRHRRTGAPVAWIFRRRSEAGTGALPRGVGSKGESRRYRVATRVRASS
jgi:4-amino-4-deoxy-L-arabinose transferase-like glycosyltransferase